MDLPGQLHQVRSGRVFVRSARGEARGSFGLSAAGQALNARLHDYKASWLVGVVEISKMVDVERMHRVRLNSALWMDAATASTPLYDGTGDLREFSVNDLLTSLSWRSHALPDSFDVFLRATAMPHEERDMHWAFIVAVLPHRLAALPTDGLYEFRKDDGFKLVDPTPHYGEVATSIVRKPVWGPGGKFGFSHCIEPDFYPTWVAAERKRNNDPGFKEFMQRMESEMPLKLYYDVEYERARNLLADRVIREVMMGEGNSPAAPVSAPRRPRP